MVTYGVFYGRFYTLGFASLQLAQPCESHISLSESIKNIIILQVKGVTDEYTILNFQIKYKISENPLIYLKRKNIFYKQHIVHKDISTGASQQHG